MKVSSVRKAVIPAAGLGTRFLPATKSQPKEMLPLVDKPTIQYVVEEAVAAGLNDILIVTGRTKRSLEDHFDRSIELEQTLESSNKFDALEQVKAIAEMANFHYVRQGEPKGLGHAVSLARYHVDDEAFAVLLGDDVMDLSLGLLPAMCKSAQAMSASVIALMRVPREAISNYGCAVVEEVEGSLVRITGVVEKPDPDEAPSNLAIMGRYVLMPSIFDALDNVKPGVGGEIQLTDAISAVMENEPIYGYVFENGRYDLGNKQDYLRATIEFALKRDDLGPGLREFLRELVIREGLN